MKPTLFAKLRKNHSFAMILCCAVPLGLIFGLSISGNLGSWGYYALLLLCPLMHVFMMRGHGSSHHSHHDQKRLLPAPEMVEEPEKIHERSA